MLSINYIEVLVAKIQELKTDLKIRIIFNIKKKII
jgi:hypothetical protein